MGSLERSMAEVLSRNSRMLAILIQKSPKSIIAQGARLVKVKPLV
jgi:hypothetical protein